jgi:uncharacterized protein (TIGR02421 family)
MSMTEYPPEPDPTRRRPSPYEHTVRSLSDRIVAAHRPIRILDAVRWDHTVATAFFAAGGREPPPVTADYYRSRPLRFDPTAKLAELRTLEREVADRLGRGDTAGDLLRRRCEEAREVVGVLTSRGTDEFPRIAARLYQTGGPPGEGRAVTALFAALAPGEPTRPENLRKMFDATDAVRLLAERLRPMIPAGSGVRIKLCDRIVADAAAGCTYVKLRRRARFSALDLALLEYHEGWVHLGTTLNGRRQPVLTALANGPPSTAATQEGLAVLCELLAGACHPGRLARLWRRTLAVRMAEAGADFLQVYRHFLRFTDDPHDSYHQAVRVFRGSRPDGCGPFAKDLCYAVGLCRVLQALAPAATAGDARTVNLLLTGKTALPELPALARLADAGLVTRAAIIPPPYRDRRALVELFQALRPALDSAGHSRNYRPRPL